MSYEIEHLDPWSIVPVNDITKPIASLVREMRQHGWRECDGGRQERPLLVVETATDYRAWTGSHRIAAAREAELDSVPCYVIAEDDLRAVVDDPHFHCTDDDRMAILRRLGDDTAMTATAGVNKRPAGMPHREAIDPAMIAGFFVRGTISGMSKRGDYYRRWVKGILEGPVGWAEKISFVVAILGGAYVYFFGRGESTWANAVWMVSVAVFVGGLFVQLVRVPWLLYDGDTGQLSTELKGAKKRIGDLEAPSPETDAEKVACFTDRMRRYQMELRGIRRRDKDSRKPGYPAPFPETEVRRCCSAIVNEIHVAYGPVRSSEFRAFIVNSDLTMINLVSSFDNAIEKLLPELLRNGDTIKSEYTIAEYLEKPLW